MIAFRTATIVLGCYLAVLTFTDDARAQRVREPLQPGRIIVPQEFLEEVPIMRETMAPPPLERELLPPDEIEIRNIGNAELTLSYWDSEEKGAWHTITVAPAQTVMIHCPKCSQNITVSFHNGKENKVLSEPMGTEFVLRWVSQEDVWEIGPSRPPTQLHTTPYWRG